MNKNTNIKVGNVIMPATAFIAAQAVSLNAQELNINNKFKSSNHIPNTNIGNQVRSSVRQGMARTVRN